jgi:ankyrin repeat protein
MASVGNLSASVGNLSIDEDPSTEERMWVCKYSPEELSDKLKHIDAKNFQWSNLLYFNLEIYRHLIAKRERKKYVSHSFYWDQEISKEEYEELHGKIMMVAKYVLDNGADPNGSIQWDESPLVQAAFYSKTPDIVNLLLDKGAKVDIPSKGNNGEYNFPLTSAIDRSRGRPFPPNLEIVKALVNKGADVNARDFSFFGRRVLLIETPLHYALDVPFGNKAVHPINVDIIKFLLEKGANPSIESRKIRAWPIYNKSPEIVQLFRDHLQKLSKEFETSFSNNGNGKRQRRQVVSTSNIRF